MPPIPDYTRRIAVITSTAPGARSIEIQRAANDLLFRQNISARCPPGAARARSTTAWSGSALRSTAPTTPLSPATAHRQAAASAADSIRRRRPTTTSPKTRVDAARQVVRTLNSGTTAIQSFRAETDQEIATAVSELNDLLAQFKDANNAVIAGTRTGRDVSDSLDRRDALLKKISEYRPGLDLHARRQRHGHHDQGRRDAVRDHAAHRHLPAATGLRRRHGRQLRLYRRHPGAPAAGGNTNAVGKLAGLVQLRDSVAGTMQSQLDEIARGLITAFAETDRPAAAARRGRPLHLARRARPCRRPARWSTALPARSALNAAIDSAPAATPRCCATAAPTAPAMSTTPAAASSYSDLLISYGDKLDQPIAFDPAAGIRRTSSVSDFPTNAISWFEGVRKEASAAAEAKEALATRTAEALSNATGVNVDKEMSLLLDLEHTYEASARLIKAVDDMLAALLAAVR